MTIVPVRVPHGVDLSLRARLLVAGIAGVIGIGALFGGYGLLADPTGAGLGLEQRWVEGTFGDYAIPGLVLLVLVGGGLLATMALALAGSRLAAAAALASGACLLVWGVVETAVIGWQGPFQAVLLVLFVAPGSVLVAIGARALRR